MNPVIIFQIFAPEVYVLDDKTILRDMQDHAVNVWLALSSSKNMTLFVVFALLIGALFGLALYFKSISIFKRIGQKIDRATVFAH